MVKVLLHQRACMHLRRQPLLGSGPPGYQQECIYYLQRRTTW